MEEIEKRVVALEEKVAELERKTQPPSMNELVNKITKKMSKKLVEMYFFQH